jgi:hypothetical protein
MITDKVFRLKLRSIIERADDKPHDLKSLLVEWHGPTTLPHEIDLVQLYIAEAWKAW